MNALILTPFVERIYCILEYEKKNLDTNPISITLHHRFHDILISQSL